MPRGLHPPVMVLAALSALMAVTTVPPAAADTRRLALVVGNNTGHDGDVPLRYAERDASRMAAVLEELGRFDDVKVLLGQGASATLAAFGEMRRLAEEHRGAGDQVLFVFYYSGHGSRDGLRMGPSQLGFAALLAELRSITSDVRFVIVDACEAGELTRGKGFRSRAPVSVHLVDSLGTTGEAILASTSQAESAQESEVLKGSFFTSHLITGLRGAADRNRDGVVGLQEAYEYAHDRTVAGTVVSAVGVQRPTYSVRLKGTSDVPLAWPGSSGAFLQFRTRSSGTFLVLSRDEDVVLAEVPVSPDAPRRIALAPGSYWVKKRSTTGVLMARVQLDQGMDAVLDEAQMSSIPYASLAQKGSRPPGLLTVEAGLATSIEYLQSSLPVALKLGYILNYDRVGLWWSLGLGGSRSTSALDGALFEIRPELAVVWRILYPRWELFYGVAGSLPLYIQLIEEERRTALGGGLDGIGGVAVWTTERFALTGHLEAGVRIVKRDGWEATGFTPNLRAGLSFGARLRF